MPSEHAGLFVKDHVYLYTAAYRATLRPSLAPACPTLARDVPTHQHGDSRETAGHVNHGEAAERMRITLFKGGIVAICRRSRGINLQYTVLTATQIVASSNNCLPEGGGRHLRSYERDTGINLMPVREIERLSNFYP